jgi:hypothetical protein
LVVFLIVLAMSGIFRFMQVHSLASLCVRILTWY